MALILGQLSSCREIKLRYSASTILLIFLFVALVGWMGGLVYLALPLPDIKLAGIFLLLIGIVNLFFNKRFGKSFFSSTQLIPNMFSKLWSDLGQRGIEIMFLGIGMIFTCAGIVLIIMGK